MKLLWHSVAPWVGTGYGQQTAQAVPRIVGAGHDVAVSCYYGLAGAKMTWRGITCYPQYAQPYGSDTIVPHAVDHFGGGPGVSLQEVAGRGVILTLGDVWTFRQPLLADMAVASWVPVDHETVPAQVLAWFEATGAVPIAMSRFGQRTLAGAGLDPLYVPHAIDTAVFCPGDRAEARDRVGLPADAFVVAIVAANVGKDGNRKAFYEQILAFRELRRRHSDAVLALHTDVTTPYGVNLRELLADLPDGSYVVSDQYAYRVGMPSERVADIMRAADVLSNCSWGEGFGVPIVEAQACGTPVIVTDTTAMPELVGGGWKVPGEPLWHDSQHAWARRPLIGAITDAYEQAYERARDQDLRAMAWAHAQDYDADRVLAEHWKPTLERLESALERRATDVPAASAVRIREADGLLWLDRGPGSGDAIGWAASHEAELRATVEGLLPEGGVLLDVGAHVGHWAVRLAGRASQVYAVEPNPQSAAGLRRNLALNDIGNVTVLELAAWDESGWLTLDDPNGQAAGGSTRTVPLPEPDMVELPLGTRVIPVGREHTAVPAARLDEDPGLVELDRLDLVKLDVEGADLHALRGMAGLLARYRPTLFVETHDCYGYYTRDQLEQTLTELGYRWETVHTYQTRWQPAGIAEQPVDADYLVCTPADEMG